MKSENHICSKCHNEMYQASIGYFLSNSVITFICVNCKDTLVIEKKLVIDKELNK